MDLLILVRSDITNTIILADLLFFSLYWRKKGAHAKDNYVFLVMATLGHVVFGLITELTVNIAAVPFWLNYTCHIIYYAFALMFVAEYYRYVLSLILPRKVVKKHMVYAYILCSLSLVTVPGLGLSFVEGKHTNYSTGTGVFVCFGVTFFMFLLATAIFIIHSRRIEKATIRAIVPITLLSMIFGFLQLYISEFLYTGCAFTLITITVFFIIENPAKNIQERALIDYSTGLCNRNCYEENFSKMDKKYSFGQFGIAVFDLNNLKYVNDNFGHKEGDTMLVLAADILQSSLKSAKKIYRIGGDEFLAIYVDSHVSEAEKELRELRKKSLDLCSFTPVPLDLAAGFCIKKEDETISELQKRADMEMYKNKALLKRERPLA